MKIVKVPKPLLFLFFLGMRKTLLFFSLSFSFSHHQILLVSKFISLVKSTNLFIFFIFNVIVVVIMFGSSKPSVGDFDLFSLLPLEQIGETVNYEDYDYDNERRLACIEYKEKKAIVEENDAKENNFLRLLVYIGLGENKGNGQEYDDKRNDFLPSLALEFDKEKGKDEERNDFLPRLERVELDEKKGNDECCADKDIEFVPRLVYVELKAKNVDDENFDGIELDGDGYCGYNDGYNDDDGDDDTESTEDEKLRDGDDLERRIEEFIAKNNKRWKEEI